MARTAAQDMNRKCDAVCDANADAMRDGLAVFDGFGFADVSARQAAGWADKAKQKDLPSWPVHVNCGCQVLPIKLRMTSGKTTR